MAMVALRKLCLVKILKKCRIFCSSVLSLSVYNAALSVTSVRSVPCCCHYIENGLCVRSGTECN